MLRWIILCALIGLSAATPVPGMAAHAQWAAILPNHQVFALAIAPGDDRVVYAGGPDGIFNTTDGGHIWRVVTEQPIGFHLAIDPRQPATLYATTGHVLTDGLRRRPYLDLQILRSTTSGMTWRAVYPTYEPPR
jgi:hypothetical protein